MFEDGGYSNRKERVAKPEQPQPSAVCFQVVSKEVSILKMKSTYINLPRSNFELVCATFHLRTFVWGCKKTTD